MKSSKTKPLLYLGVSFLAVCMASAGLGAHAQEAAGTDAKADDQKAEKPEKKKDDDSVVVVGLRKSLKTAQQVKKDAENVVDVITAADVGSFPDKSVAEALQRVAGVTVSRFAATGDTQHFSGEPSGIIIRGLPQVKSQFNGRESFSADSSRGLGWGDITPELMSRIEVYKNQSADLIEGGISGLVDLHTRVPFDNKGRLLAFSVDQNYSFVANKPSPSVSGIYSNRWSTDLGEFGVMVNAAYSHTHDRTQSVYNGRYGAYRDVFGANTLKYIPTFISTRDSMYDRERTGVAAAVQWQNNDHTMLATMQYNRSDYHNAQTEYTNLNWIYFLWGRDSRYEITKDVFDRAFELPGHPFEFNDDGTFKSGLLSSDRGWWGGTDAEAASRAAINTGQPLVGSVSCSWTGTCDPATADRKGVNMEAGTRRIIEDTTTEDTSFNFKWDVTPRLRTNFDVQYVHAIKTGRGGAGALASYTGMDVDFGGELPKIAYSAPLNVNLPTGGLTNPNAWRYGFIQEHKEDNVGNQLALKADGEYMFEGKWLNSLKFGVRTTKRDQVVQSAWPFRGIAGEWGEAAYYNTDRTTPANVTYNGVATRFNGYPDPMTMLVLHAYPKNYMSGGVKDTDPILYIDPSVYTDSSRLAKLSASALGIGDYNPICSGLGNRSNEIIGADGKSTCYTQDEHLKVDETTRAAYLMLRFGGSDATVFGTGISISGNIGVRYIETETTSHGTFNYNGFDTAQLYCAQQSFTAPTDPNVPYTPPANPYTDGCYIVGAAKHNAMVASMPDTIPNPDTSAGAPATIPNPAKFILPSQIVGSPEDALFHDGTADAVDVSVQRHNLLPSFNLKVKWNDKMQSHFAYSKAMSRPDMGMFRYQVDLGHPGPDVSRAAQCRTWDPVAKVDKPLANCTIDRSLINVSASGELLGATPKYSAWAGNPFIKPITADNIDATFEYYFSSTGSWHVDLFYKKFYDYITYGQVTVPITHNGVTRQIYLNGPLNGDGASVKGLEFAYHRSFEFLPAPWNGLGIDTNYTVVKNHGVTNTNLDAGSGSSTSLNITDGVAVPKDTFIKVDALEGMSKYAYNFTLFYERAKFGGRLAYNWRSKYLVTSNDCCNYPQWQSGAGYLDGSLTYRMNSHIEFSLLASNLTDTTTKLLQQVTDAEPGKAGKLVPGAWFKSDRRVIFSARFRY
jgi:iron complex outermembrane recepter protein